MAPEKMLKVISGQGNANQNREIPHPLPLGWLESTSQITDVAQGRGETRSLALLAGK